MEVANNNKELYQRFLRKKKIGLQIGDYFPKVPLYHREGKPVTVYDYIEDHLLVFVYSTACDPCISAMDSLQDFLNQKNERCLILLESDKKSLSIVKDVFDGKAEVIPITFDKLENKFTIYETPKGYSVNKSGQIIVEITGDAPFLLEELIKPFSK